MKTTRSAHFLRRLIGWRELYTCLRSQPIISWVEELSVEEALRRFNYMAPDGSVGVKVGFTVHSPLEVEVDPTA